ncbi:NYN domain-containing protein [Adlercreutzia faecimuris]|uniref:NYN domain-containing protein n=1 Tax=Adlercreutzia faecimuris TaxID=2897341 RepID=A0ABS9WJG8_9ACTN|nr:NYN domain-containing protein [Adlercreutzia sp. JBNU-10]MCI2242685.1 NYN domain-containing protein [Adlercreutzia sp. JBNU-10]
MEPKSSSDKRFALLIDADNVSAKYIKPILNELSKYGTVTIKRIYGDWTLTLHAKWKDALLENSLTPIQQFGYTYGKNATDSAMIIDAMDILYGDNVDGFCLVSSDSDFTRLASRLRESGRTVIGMGEKKTPTPFRRACDIFTTLELLLDSRKGDRGNGNGAPAISKAEVEQAVVDIITDNQNNGKSTGLGEVGSRLQKRYPDFDVRNYGTNLLSKLLDEFTRVVITKDRSSVTVELADGHHDDEAAPAPEPAAAEAAPAEEAPAAEDAASQDGAARRSRRGRSGRRVNARTRDEEAAAEEETVVEAVEEALEAIDEAAAEAVAEEEAAPEDAPKRKPTRRGRRGGRRRSGGDAAEAPVPEDAAPAEEAAPAAEPEPEAQPAPAADEAAPAPAKPKRARKAPAKKAAEKKPAAAKKDDAPKRPVGRPRKAQPASSPEDYIAELVRKAGAKGIGVTQLSNDVRARFKDFKVRDLGFPQMRAYLEGQPGFAVEKEGRTFTVRAR